MEPWVAIQRNPRSGTGRRRRYLLDLIRAIRRRGLRTRVFTNREKLALRLADPEQRAAVHCLVAAGGDGTVGDVVNRYPGLPVCPFPLGTENLLCRHIGLPLDGETVAELIAHGPRQSFDVGLANDRRFLLVASAGLDADVVDRLHRKRGGNISRMHYAKPLLSSLWNYPFHPVRVFADDATQPVTGSLVVAANVPDYGLRLPIVPMARPDDGLLTVAVFERPGALALLRYGWQVVWKRHLRLSDVHFVTGSSIRLESDHPVPVEIDGDPWGTTNCLLSVLPGDLQLVTPATYRG